MKSWLILFIAVVFAGCGAPQPEPDYDLVNMDEDKSPPSVDLLLDPDRQPPTPAPDTFQVAVETTKGTFIIEVYREWGPIGVDRFHHLVSIGYYSDIAIFRAIAGFMFQFGIHGEPSVADAWREAKIEDDPKHMDASNVEGTITFANAGAKTRTTQLFINLGNNARLDTMNFPPFGKVIEGIDIVRSINTQYGENREPQFQDKFQQFGNDYVRELYPELDFIISMKIVE